MRSAKTILAVENSKTRSTTFFQKRNENAPQTFLQPKLNIGPVDDPYEREADAIAERVMRTPPTRNEPFFTPNQLPVSNLQRKCTHCEEEENKVQMKETSGSRGGMIAPPLVNEAISSRGQPLDDSTRNFMESRFGYDFGNVQVHNDSMSHRSSKEINALAYTHDNHIAFAEGAYQPETDQGKKLLAHELAHVVQQGSDQVIHRQPDTKKEKANAKAGEYTTGGLIAYGNMVNGTEDMPGFVDKDVYQKLGDLFRKKKVCWEGDYVGVELFFGSWPVPGDGSCPKTIPPFISVKLSYKEAGGFTSYRYKGSDSSPVWFSGGHKAFNWHPAIQTFFTYPLNKKGTLDVYLEIMDVEDDRMLVYQDKIDFVKCNVETSCRENATSTGKWAVIPDNGGPTHPLTGTADDGERYEIFKENDSDNYFICLSETFRIPVDSQGYRIQ